jgi:hypothetical protein
VARDWRANYFRACSLANLGATAANNCIATNDSNKLKHALNPFAQLKTALNA